MTLKSSVFIAISLDGFIARKDGNLDWLDAANATVPKGEDCGYSAFMSTIDTLVMGRNTFEKVLSFGIWSYGDKPVIVLSSKKLVVPDDISNTVTHSSEKPSELCERLLNDGCKRIYVDGGVTVQRFLDAGLIDDITITLIPIVLGNGIPLFANLHEDISFELIDSKVFEFGFVNLTYRRIKE